MNSVYIVSKERSNNVVSVHRHLRNALDSFPENFLKQQRASGGWRIFNPITDEAYLINRHVVPDYKDLV